MRFSLICTLGLILTATVVLMLHQSLQISRLPSVNDPNVRNSYQEFQELFGSADKISVAQNAAKNSAAPVYEIQLLNHPSSNPPISRSESPKTPPNPPSNVNHEDVMNQMHPEGEISISPGDAICGSLRTRPPIFLLRLGEQINQAIISVKQILKFAKVTNRCYLFLPSRILSPIASESYFMCRTFVIPLVEAGRVRPPTWRRRVRSRSKVGCSPYEF
jgi:hypothetical protein